MGIWLAQFVAGRMPFGDFQSWRFTYPYQMVPLPADRQVFPVTASTILTALTAAATLWTRKM